MKGLGCGRRLVHVAKDQLKTIVPSAEPIQKHANTRVASIAPSREVPVPHKNSA